MMSYHSSMSASQLGMAQVCYIHVSCDTVTITFSVSITYPATSDEDYCAVSSILIFDSSQRSCVFVSIVDDDVVEETESFIISMVRTPENLNFGLVSGDIKINGMFVWT